MWFKNLNEIKIEFIKFDCDSWYLVVQILVIIVARFKNFEKTSWNLRWIENWEKIFKFYDNWDKISRLLNRLRRFEKWKNILKFYWNRRLKKREKIFKSCWNHWKKRFFRNSSNYFYDLCNFINKIIYRIFNKIYFDNVEMVLNIS